MGGIMGVMVWLALLFGSERESLIVSGVDEGGVEETVNWKWIQSREGEVQFVLDHHM